MRNLSFLASAAFAAAALLSSPTGYIDALENPALLVRALETPFDYIVVGAGTGDDHSYCTILPRSLTAFLCSRTRGCLSFGRSVQPGPRPRSRSGPEERPQHYYPRICRIHLWKRQRLGVLYDPSALCEFGSGLLASRTGAGLFPWRTLYTDNST